MHGMTDLQIFIALSQPLGHSDGRLRQLAIQACGSMVEIYSTPMPPMAPTSPSPGSCP